MTGATIYLLDIASPEQRGRFIAANQGALLVGVGFGPALGGLLAERYSLSMPFFVVAAAAVVTAIYSFFRLPETRTVRKPAVGGAGSQPAPSRWALLRSVDFLLVGLVTIGVFSVRSGVRQTLVPLQLSEAFGLTVSELGVLFTALGIIGVVLIWPAGWATDRFGRKTIIVPTGTLIAVGVGIVAIADTLPMFIFGLTMSAVGSSITGPAPAAYVADLVSEDQRGAAMGLYRTFGDIGVVVSPVLSGLLADAVSIPFAIGVNAAFMGVAVVAFMIFADSSRP
jgi:MFS family permease